MEQLFRKYFWAVHLAFLAVVALILASTVNFLVEGQLLPGPSTAASKAPTRVRPPEPAAKVNLDRLAKITGLPVPAPEPEVKEPQAANMDLASAPVKTSLRLKLLGTLVAESTPEWSIASIQDLSSQKTQTFMTGDLVQDAEVLNIERERVIILHNNRREYIDSQPGEGAPAPVAGAPVTTMTTGGATTNLGSGIRSTAENEYEVPRAEIDKTLSNLNDVAMQARIVPAFQDGVAKGFKLFSIRPDSIYSKIGVQNGDVIRRINGFDLNSPEKALEVYSKLKDTNRIDIEIERNGSVMKKTYNVR